MSALPDHHMTREEYYALEERGLGKHEYLQGHIFAMTGGSMAHSRIAVNISATLNAQLRGKPCQTLNSDFRIKITATGLETYPDVSVICRPLQFVEDRRDVATNPVVIVEVLSPSTEEYDRGTKFKHYRTIPSLRAYLLVSQEQMLVEHWTRQDEHTWVIHDYTAPDQEFRIEAIGVTMKMTDIYDGVEPGDAEASASTTGE